MKLTDEMILETDVDEAHCPQQLADVSVLQIAENRGSCHSIPRERIPERIIAQIVKHVRTHPHKVVEKINSDCQSHPASCKRTGC